MKVLNHTHTFVRAKKFFSEMHYKCNDPDCAYLSSITKLLGKRSICSICHTNEIILTHKQLRLARPRCQECSKSPKDQQAVANKAKIDSVIDQLFSTADKLAEEEKENNA